MQFTKVHQKLAKPVYEAIPKIAHEAGKKWEWEPERGEFAQIGMGMIVLVDRDGLFENKFVETSDMGLVEKDRLIPFLHWERIEEMLEGMGWSRFEFSFWINGRVETCSRKTMSKPDTSDWKMLCSATGKDRQEAVQKAILALVEQLEEKQ